LTRDCLWFMCAFISSQLSCRDSKSYAPNAPHAPTAPNAPNAPTAPNAPKIICECDDKLGCCNTFSVGGDACELAVCRGGGLKKKNLGMNFCDYSQGSFGCHAFHGWFTESMLGQRDPSLHSFHKMYRYP